MSVDFNPNNVCDLNRDSSRAELSWHTRQRKTEVEALPVENQDA